MYCIYRSLWSIALHDRNGRIQRSNLHDNVSFQIMSDLFFHIKMLFFIVLLSITLCEITSQTYLNKSAQSDEGDCSDIAGGHAEGGCGKEGRDKFLHVADDQRLHEKSHRC
jgi:hypothetical protein